MYGQRDSKWDPYATKSKHHPSGSFDKPEDVWNSNKELIKKKAKKKQRLAAEGLDPEGQRVAPAGRARSGLGGASWGTWKHLALL